MRLSLPPTWRGQSKTLFLFREEYEAELLLLKRFLSGGNVFVDVGACFGIYTLLASQIVGDRGRVIAVEPAQHSFSVLERNIGLNRLRNVRAFRMALVDKNESVVLGHHEDTSRNSLLMKAKCAGGVARNTEVVPGERLDRLLADCGVSRVDMMKLDVEGAEELVLRGGSNVFASCRPRIIFEVNPAAATNLGLAPAGAWEFLETLDYRFYRLEESDNLKRLDALPTGGNVVAIPPRA